MRTEQESLLNFKKIVCPAFSLVIPVYNEEKSIAKTLNNLRQILELTNCEYEIIVVNDGSTDDTGDILCSYLDIRIIEHIRNRGYGAALKTGIRQAKYAIIAMTDADGTYPNELIPELVAMTADADMVVGARIGSGVDNSNLRQIPDWFLLRFAEWLTMRSIPDLNSGLRVFRKSVVEEFFNFLPERFNFTTMITLAMLTKHYIVHYVPIDYHPRVGESKINPLQSTLRFVQLILRTSLYFAPLKVFLPIASLFFLGFLMTLYQDLFIRHDLTGVTLLLFLAATQLGMFALLADMINERNLHH